MKTFAFIGIPFLVSLASSVSAIAGDAPGTESAPSISAMSPAAIAQIRVQEISRTLVDLKLQEVALRRAAAVDNEKIALVQAQQAALERELDKISISALE